MKLLIANRGEIVSRIVKSCRKLDIIPCGVYSEADKNSIYVKFLYEAQNIGGLAASDTLSENGQDSRRRLAIGV